MHCGTGSLSEASTAELVDRAPAVTSTPWHTSCMCMLHCSWQLLGMFIQGCTHPVSGQQGWQHYSTHGLRTALFRSTCHLLHTPTSHCHGPRTLPCTCGCRLTLVGTYTGFTVQHKSQAVSTVFVRAACEQRVEGSNRNAMRLLLKSDAIAVRTACRNRCHTCSLLVQEAG